MKAERKRNTRLSSLEEVERMELASADLPVPPEGHLKLVRAYRTAGLQDAATSELTRLCQRFPQDPLVMAEQLDVSIERRAMSSLKSLLRRAESVRTPPRELRAAMAVSLTHLRQYARAAAHFSAVLEHQPRSDRLLSGLAEFVRLYPESPPVVSALRRIAFSNAFHALPVLLQYAVLRSHVDTDRVQASKYLKAVRLEDINSYEVALDIAVLALLLRDWTRAIAAADRAKELSPNGLVAERIQVSAFAFAGKLAEAQTRISAQHDSGSAVRLSEPQAAALREFMERRTGDKDSHATIITGETPCQAYRIVTHTYQELSEGLSEDYAGPGQTLRVSRVGQAKDVPGAWDVLAEVDLTVPQLILQDLGPHLILHAFVAVHDGVENWAWREAPIALSEGDASALPGVSFLAAQTTQTDEHIRATRNTWQRIEAEVDRIQLKEEGYHDDGQQRHS